MADGAGPLYQRVADDIRAQISTGRLAVGDPIPSTAALMKLYRVSSTVARRAVGVLQAEGLAVGQPGKAVYVAAEPAVTGTLADQVAELRTALGVAEANLIALYERHGLEYPRPA